MIREYLQSLAENQFFGAGAGLAGLGVGLSLFKKASVLGNAYFRRKFIISLHVTNTDPAYPWLLRFINQLSDIGKQTRNLASHTAVSTAENGKTDADFQYQPGYGMHYIRYQNRFVSVERQRENQSIQKDGFRTPFETVTLKTIGTDPGFFKQMLVQAKNEALSQEETGTVIYKAVGPEWRRFGRICPKRPLASIVLDVGVSDRISSDLRKFLRKEKWYANRGVPYRRGYLLYGPPGCGKSSFVYVLAGELGYSVCIASLSERTLDDGRLDHLLNTAPKNSFVLLEDMNQAFLSGQDHPSLNAAYDGLTRVTFSGLLNALDGVAATCSKGRVLFMTTNNIERLDPALIRPGRVDLRQHFSNCTDYMLQQMFVCFYEDGEGVTKELQQEFVAAVRRLNVEVSPAQIQGLLCVHEFDSAEAVKCVPDLASDTTYVRKSDPQ